ncbi:protein indeterminate-domain 16 [Dendrobium catenatum]|uniref:Zinc finger protein MAGPIE n=1 Tax=Dendrobium catenatum TaxID=906689 RepID=A0A2I0XFQ3_9ASPA|nr:protein indeterminate-domain 16 [Dendrobium catenatum]PKU86719.1 Zinc finger protein MAGPIE [Dendrobium catenatum]
MFVSTSPVPPAATSSPAPPNAISATKRKRRPAGTPDPEAEVVSLSPRTLLESDRYVCEICNQGFQRDQNLQMHRRRHKVPWKLLKRESGSETRKRVFVCPEPSCLHHDPSHALGDLVGIKKHFRRKHSAHKQWACARCTKAYAVHSDYKAHLKTCGTRGHSCDCGRVFSRVESFIEHQDTCNAGRARPAPPACVSRSASSQSPSSDQTIFIPPPALLPTASMWQALRPPKTAGAASFLQLDHYTPSSSSHILRRRPNIELQLLPAEPGIPSSTPSPSSDDTRATKLELTIGNSKALDEKVMADEARQEAKRQMELAEQEFANAKRIRQQAQLELNKAFALRDRAAKKIHSILLQITCLSCKQQFYSKATASPMLFADDYSLTASYISSVVTEGEGDEENHDHDEREPRRSS